MIDMIIAGPVNPELQRLADWARREGYTCKCQVDQAGVEKCLAAEPVKVIFASHNLAPDGIEGLLEDLHRRKDAPPVVTMAALTDSRVAASGVQAGAFDFLPLPFDPDEVVRCLDRIMRFREKETHEGFLRYEADGSGMRLLLPTEVDHDEAMEVVRLIETGLPEGLTGILVDFSATRYICSAMVSALFLLDSLCKARGIPCRLTGVGGRVRHVLDTAGVLAVMETRIERGGQ